VLVPASSRGHDRCCRVANQYLGVLVAVSFAVAVVTSGHRVLFVIAITAVLPSIFLCWWRRLIQSKGARTAAASTPVMPRARLE
jgi:hypothetical protein